MIAFVLVLIMVAVPLYLLRRPGAAAGARSEDGGAAEAGAAEPGKVVRSRLDAGKTALEPVSLGAPQRVKCSASPTTRGNQGSLCDQLPLLEEALARAIRDNVSCAPKIGKEGTINYVLTADFSRKRVSVFPGASGTWKGPQARKAAQCVRRSLPPIEWAAISHQYRYYMIAIMATYPAATAGGLPEFE